MKLFIPLILGTGREGRMSEHVAKFVFEIMTSDDRFETALIDVRDYPSAFTARVDEEKFDDRDLVKTILRADGFVIVSPEYNHGYPGELKIFLDHYYPEFAQKPVGICGVSNGPWGGTRMIEGLRTVLTAFNVVNCQRAAMFVSVDDLFTDGSMGAQDAQRYTKSVMGVLEQVVWYAQALKTARG